MEAGSGSPCGACKFLRRKCAADCIFAPYFSSSEGSARFAAIHKVFGASNVSKLLLNVPVPDRFDATVTIAYEAQARIRDPVHGCVAHIFALQQQVAYLQAQLMQMKIQLATNLVHKSKSRNSENQYWPSSSMMAAGIGSSPPFLISPNYNNHYSISPQSSLESVDGFSAMQSEMQISRDEVVSFQPHHSKKRSSSTELSELQELALKMMKNES